MCEHFFFSEKEILHDISFCGNSKLVLLLLFGLAEKMANPPQPVFINPETDPEKLRELSSKVFENVGDYLNAEFTGIEKKISF